MQLFIWYPVAPELLLVFIGTWFKAELDPTIQFFVSPMLCLRLFTSARLYEKVHSGIQRCPMGSERHTGYGTPWVGLSLFLSPNAYRIIMPPMISEMLNLVKSSSRHYPGPSSHQRRDYAGYALP
ncbi:MAG: Glutamate/aspartate import permease protein GltJ [Sodalis sp.]|nr:MAG: Glutamate/aspartate import permease protein GltJ [Sodalis sp.]